MASDSESDSERLRVFRRELASRLLHHPDFANSYGAPNYSAFARRLYVTSYGRMRKVLAGERLLTRRFIEECASVLGVPASEFTAYGSLPEEQRVAGEVDDLEFLRRLEAWARAQDGQSSSDA